MRGWGWGSRGLNRGSEKEHIVILCWGTHREPKKNEKKSYPPPRGPSSQNLKGIKALECTLEPSIGTLSARLNLPLAPWVHAWTFHWVCHRLEPEWEMQRTGWGDWRGALCTGFTLVIIIVMTRSMIGSYDLYLDFLAQNACVEWLVSSRFRRRWLPLLGFVCACASFSRFVPCTLLCRGVSATTTHRARTGRRRRRRRSTTPSFLLLLRLLLLVYVCFCFFFFPSSRKIFQWLLCTRKEEEEAAAAARLNWCSSSSAFELVQQY